MEYVTAAVCRTKLAQDETVDTLGRMREADELH